MKKINYANYVNNLVQDKNGILAKTSNEISIFNNEKLVANKIHKNPLLNI